MSFSPQAQRTLTGPSGSVGRTSVLPSSWLSSLGTHGSEERQRKGASVFSVCGKVAQT